MNVLFLYINFIFLIFIWIYIPYTQSFIVASTHDLGSIRTVADAGDIVGMTLQRLSYRLPSDRIPFTQCGIAASTYDSTAIRTVAHAGYRTGGPLIGFLPAFQFQNPIYTLSIASTDDSFSIRTITHTAYKIGVS